MAEQLRDGFVWRCLNPVCEIFSLVSEGAGDGPLSVQGARGIVGASVTARDALSVNGRYISDHYLPDPVEARRADLHLDAADALPALAAVAMIATGEHGEEIREELGLDASDFHSAAAQLYILIRDRYRYEGEEEDDG